MALGRPAAGSVSGRPGPRPRPKSRPGRGSRPERRTTRRRGQRMSCANRSSTPGPDWSPTLEASTGRWRWPGSCAAWASTRSRRAGRSSGSSTARAWPGPAAARPATSPRACPIRGSGPAQPGTTHQIDMVGPRHLDGAVEFHALNLIDVGLPAHGQPDPQLAPPDTGGRRDGRDVDHAGVLAVAQFDNHSNFGPRSPGLVAVRSGRGHLFGPRRRRPRLSRCVEG